MQNKHIHEKLTFLFKKKLVVLNHRNAALIKQMAIYFKTLNIFIVASYFY